MVVVRPYSLPDAGDSAGAKSDLLSRETLQEMAARRPKSTARDPGVGHAPT